MNIHPDPRITQLRAWSVWNDQAYAEHGTDEGIAARREANRIADQLGDFTDADWGIIRLAQRGYYYHESEVV